jgi:hypothetical protein
MVAATWLVYAGPTRASAAIVSALNVRTVGVPVPIATCVPSTRRRRPPGLPGVQVMTKWWRFPSLTAAVRCRARLADEPHARRRCRGGEPPLDRPADAARRGRGVRDAQVGERDVLRAAVERRGGVRVVVEEPGGAERRRRDVRAVGGVPGVVDGGRAGRLAEPVVRGRLVSEDDRLVAGRETRRARRRPGVRRRESDRDARVSGLAAGPRVGRGERDRYAEIAGARGGACVGRG